MAPGLPHRTHSTCRPNSHKRVASAQSPHQLPGIYAQAVSNLDDVVQRQVPLSTLDLTDVRPVQIAALC